MNPDWTKTDNIKEFDKSKLARDQQRAADEVVASTVYHTGKYQVGEYYKRWARNTTGENREAIKTSTGKNFRSTKFIP